MQQDFLESFEGGEGHAFFELWNEHIPSSVQSRDLTCQHLECNLSAYFAVYPLRTGVCIIIKIISSSSFLSHSQGWK